MAPVFASDTPWPETIDVALDAVDASSAISLLPAELCVIRPSGASNSTRTTYAPASVGTSVASYHRVGGTVESSTKRVKANSLSYRRFTVATTRKPSSSKTW